MPDGPEITSPGSHSKGTPYGNYNHDQSTSYISRPPTFNGNSIEFGWWKSKMYTHTLDLMKSYGIFLQMESTLKLME